MDELIDCWIGCTGEATRCTGDFAALPEDAGREECWEGGSAMAVLALAGAGWGRSSEGVGDDLETGLLAGCLLFVSVMSIVRYLG